MLLAIALAAAPPPVPIASSGPWNVETDPDLCILSRQYGDARDRFVLGFQPTIVRESLDVVLIVPTRRPRQDRGSATITREPDGKVFEGRYVTLATRRGDQLLTRITTDPALFDGLTQTSALRIKAGSLSRAVEVMNFAKAKPVFETCERNLKRSFGIDPANESVVAARPTGPLSRFFGPADYPREALQSRIIGRVSAVLVVDATGKVASCRVVSSAGSALNEATCRQATRIPFTPGLDAAGRPVVTPYVLTVSWQLP